MHPDKVPRKTCRKLINAYFSDFPRGTHNENVHHKMFKCKYIVGLTQKEAAEKRYEAPSVIVIATSYKLR